MNQNSNLRIAPQAWGSGDRAAQRRENNSLRVLQAAESLFSNSGFFEVSMAQIAAAAGVADGTFRPVDPYRGAVALQAVTIEYLFLHVDDPKNHPIEELLPELRAIAIGGLTNSEPHGKSAALAAVASLQHAPTRSKEE